mgnify:CR=1 FL=1
MYGCRQTSLPVWLSTKSAFRDLAPAKCLTIIYLLCLYRTIFTGKKSIPIMQIGHDDKTKILRFVGLVFALVDRFLKAQKAQIFI